MKKTYIIPQTSVTMLGSIEHLLEDSAHTTGGVDVKYGGKSEGGMTSDVKADRNDYNVWDDDWSR